MHPDVVSFGGWHELADNFATAILLLASGSSCGRPAPNVVLVLVDDAGYGDLSCHGNPVLKTPHIDQLHAQSVRLTDFHVAPMCTPTRGQLLTGVDALRNGAMNVSSGRTLVAPRHPHPGRPVSSPPAIAPASSANGIWATTIPIGPRIAAFSSRCGFRRHTSLRPRTIGTTAISTPGCGTRTGEIRQSQGYCTDVYFDAAMHWIADRKAAGEPFFVYLPLNAAHSPLLVPDKYRELYAGQPEPVARFFGMIANIDENMGRLDTLLDEQGLRDNTIVIYMTDNGGTVGVPVFNAGMRGHKTELYDGGHRVPCFIRWPGGGLGTGADVDELTGVQDVLPTLAELCGLKIPDGTHLDGTSLAGLFRGTQPVAARPHAGRAVQPHRSPKPAKGDAAVLLGQVAAGQRPRAVRHRHRSGPGPRRGGRASRRRQENARSL